jgi:hypothetical protein
VRIDHHDMAVRRDIADPVEDQCGRGRLARAGAAEQREMPPEQRIDVQRGAYVAGRIDRADLDMRAVVGGVDLLHVGGGDRIDHATGCGIARHATAEIVDLAGQLLLVGFTEEVDLRGDPVGMAVEQLERADVGDQPGRADPHLDLAADRARARDDRIFVRARLRQRDRIEHDHPARPRDVEHDADFRWGRQRGGIGEDHVAGHFGHVLDGPGVLD